MHSLTVNRFIIETAVCYPRVLCFTKKEQPTEGQSQYPKIFSHEVAKSVHFLLIVASTGGLLGEAGLMMRFGVYYLKHKQAQFDFIIRMSFLVCLQCLKLSNSQDDVHAKFAKLLSDLNKADTLYTLSVANRLYGEQSYQFVKVCVRV